jgi:hypothetical protein
MIRISITAEAYEVIAAAMPFGSAGFEREPDDKGERQIWLEPRYVDRRLLLRRIDNPLGDLRSHPGILSVMSAPCRHRKSLS